MASERFETTQPEAFLFGDNMDLNFLGKPTPFPYPAPQPNEPTRTLKSLMNIRKETLRFVKTAPQIMRSSNLRSSSAPQIKGQFSNTDGKLWKIGESSTPLLGDTKASPNSLDRPAKLEITTITRQAWAPEPSERADSLSTAYNIEFFFDTDVRCSITIYYFCTEEISSNAVMFIPKHPCMNSETYIYKAGVNQQFSQTSHVFDPSKYSEELLTYKFTDETIPVLIQCVALEGEEPRQSHALLATVEKNADSTYTLKPLKQKIFIDGLCYLMQEIYGIENKNAASEAKRDIADEDDVDYGLECVICMSDQRDTLILPCRHLALCNACADSLRYAANNCPICRAPFRALLQIRAVRKSTSPLAQVSHNQENQDIPPGYEPVSLIEALNGPLQAASQAFPPFGASQIPPFSNSPDIRQKHRHLERHHSSAASLRHHESKSSDSGGSPSERKQSTLEASVVSEVLSSIKSPEKASVSKTESLSLTRGEGRKHRKGFRTSSAPEKMRLLGSSVQIVSEVGSAKKKMDKDAELAETKSLLESNLASEEMSAVVSSPKASRPCSRSSPSRSISLSTPHSLHLCERSSKDTSGGEDSDYYTPEDPSTTILVDQGTDTSLDTPQNSEATQIGNLVKTQTDYPQVVKHKSTPIKHPLEEATGSDGDLITEIKSPDCSKKTDSSMTTIKSSNSLVASIENPSSLPSTPASNASNNSSGDSFSSSSSTRLLLRPQSHDTLPE